VISRWESVRLVAGREIRQALRGKSFWVTAALFALASTALMILPEVLGGDDHRSYEVAVVDIPEVAAEQLAAIVEAAGDELELVDAASVDEARRLVDEDEVHLAIAADGDDVRIIVQAGEEDDLVLLTRQALASAHLVGGLRDAGLGDAEVEALLSGPTVRVDELDADQESREQAAFLLALSLYFLLFIAMMGVAANVALEKSNRVMEVLLPVAPPGVLLFGKVLGAGAVASATMLAGAAPVLVKLGVGGDLPEGLGAALAGGIVWFLLGAALYLILAGALAALVDRQEDSGVAIGPLSIVLIGAYMLGGTAPESTISRVFGVLPLTSPMVMPARIAVGAASVGEVVASLVLGVLAVVAAARVGGLVYRRAIVRTGRRLKLREVLTQG